MLQKNRVLYKLGSPDNILYTLQEKLISKGFISSFHLFVKETAV